jgi:hypothetical protein
MHQGKYGELYRQTLREVAPRLYHQLSRQGLLERLLALKQREISSQVHQVREQLWKAGWDGGQAFLEAEHQVLDELLPKDSEQRKAALLNAGYLDNDSQYLERLVSLGLSPDDAQDLLRYLNESA